MRIPCPYCGPRGNDEFTFLGGVAPPRPTLDDAETWHDYVYQRDNVAGVHREYWQHVHGCRAWLVVTRDTRTHAVLGAEAAEQRAAGTAPPPPDPLARGEGEGPAP